MPLPYKGRALNSNLSSVVQLWDIDKNYKNPIDNHMTI